MRRCHTRISETYLAIDRALTGRPDGLHVASQMTKSMSSCSASSISASGAPGGSLVSGEVQAYEVSSSIAELAEAYSALGSKFKYRPYATPGCDASSLLWRGWCVIASGSCGGDCTRLRRCALSAGVSALVGRETVHGRTEAALWRHKLCPRVPGRLDRYTHRHITYAYTCTVTEWRWVHTQRSHPTLMFSVVGSYTDGTTSTAV